MDAVWPRVVVEENSLDRNISLLRKTLGEAPGDNRFIVTVPGRGYRFVAKVEGVPPGATSPPQPSRWRWRIAIGLVAILALIAVLTYRVPPPPAAISSPLVVLIA